MAIKTFVTTEDVKVETIYLRAELDGHISNNSITNGPYFYDVTLKTPMTISKDKLNDIKNNLNKYKFVVICKVYPYSGNDIAYHIPTVCNTYLYDNEVYVEFISEFKPGYEYAYGEGYLDNRLVRVTGYLVSSGIATTDVTIVSGGWSCLLEGTMIDMSDGTQKPIENISSGDLVKSYNPVTKEIVPAVVLRAYLTGMSRKYDVYNFSNGKHLVAYGLHGIYDNASGTTKPLSEADRDDRFVDIDGNLIQWAGTREIYFAGEKKRRYNLVTSNNLYFANGILLGSRPYNKYQLCLDWNIPLPDEIKEVWKQDCDDYNEFNAVLNNPDFYAEVAEDYQELAKSKNIIRVNKKRLERTDYKNAKRVEGLIEEEEWNDAKDKRSNYRRQINDSEVSMKSHQKNVNDVIARYRHGKTSKSIFDACCKRDNAIFETVKNYFK